MNDRTEIVRNMLKEYKELRVELKGENDVYLNGVIDGIEKVLRTLEVKDASDKGIILIKGRR